MDAAYNYFKKTAILFAIALLSAAPSFAQQLSANPASVTLTGSNSHVNVSLSGPSSVSLHCDAALADTPLSTA